MPNASMGGMEIGGGSSGSSIPTFTTGSIVFQGASSLDEDNSNLFWDNTSNRLGIGTNSPSYQLELLRAGLAATTQDEAAAGLALRNTTVSTGSVTKQWSPSLFFEGHAWQSSNSSDKLLRFHIQARTIDGVTGPNIYLMFSTYNGTSNVDMLSIGATTAGGGNDIRFGDGNLIFKNSARGIYFTANPLTDATPSSFFIAGGGSNGRIDLTPLVGGSQGFVNIDHNQFGSATGTIPVINLRAFDNSTTTPIPGPRIRAVPGGTAGVGFGGSVWFQASSSTTSNQDQGKFDCVWSTATHGSRSADFVMRLVDNANALAEKFRFASTGLLTIANATLIKTTVAFTNGAGASAGTLTNAPSAGDPTKWIPVDDNGTTRYIPSW